MRRLAPAALLALALALAGCASTTGPYGNFVESEGLDHKKLARDAVKQLAALYPPAKTRFELKQRAPDAFGTALVATLRQQGYAVVEQAQEAKPEGAPAQAPARAAPALPLSYILDHAGESETYRLSVLVGTQSLSRAYLVQNGSFVPAGYWVRKE